MIIIKAFIYTGRKLQHSSCGRVNQSLHRPAILTSYLSIRAFFLDSEVISFQDDNHAIIFQFLLKILKAFLCKKTTKKYIELFNNCHILTMLCFDINEISTEVLTFNEILQQLFIKFSINVFLIIFIVSSILFV